MQRKDFTTILLRQGLGALSFGATMEDVEVYFGHPYRETVLPPKIRDLVIWQFGKPVRITAVFKKGEPGYRLIGLKSSSRELLLFNRPLIDLTVDDAETFLESNSIVPIGPGRSGDGEETMEYSDGLILTLTDRVEEISWWSL